MRRSDGLRVFQRSDYGAKHVRTGGKIPRPDTVTNAIDSQRRHRPKALRKFGKDCRAGRRDELVGFIDLSERNSPKDLQSGRGRNGEGAVRALDGPMTFVQSGGEDAFDAERFQSDARHHNVGDGVQSTDFMKMDVACRNSVDLSFRLRNALENPERVFFSERGKIARLDHPPNLRMSSAMAVLVIVVIAAAMIVVMLMFVFAMFMRVRMSVIMLVLAMLMFMGMTFRMFVRMAFLRVAVRMLVLRVL